MQYVIFRAYGLGCFRQVTSLTNGIHPTAGTTIVLLQRKPGMTGDVAQVERGVWALAVSR
jgi:hypothetical protein